MSTWHCLTTNSTHPAFRARWIRKTSMLVKLDSRRLTLGDSRWYFYKKDDQKVSCRRSVMVPVNITSAKYEVHSIFVVHCVTSSCRIRVCLHVRQSLPFSVVHDFRTSVKADSGSVDVFPCRVFGCSPGPFF